MSNDLTILHYTANRVDPAFAARIRAHLLSVVGDTPIVTVSQRPLDFGQVSIALGDIGYSAYNVYHQIVIAARAASTRYVAMAEDDSLYTASHFAMRPEDDQTFLYNKHRYWLEPTTFRWRDRSGMFTCIASRELLIETLELRARKAPWDPHDRIIRRSWAEPGRYEHNLGLPHVKLDYAMSAEPVVTVNHRDSLGGRRAISDTDVLVPTLTRWGSAEALWKQLYGEV